jgi:hypothetical protein
MKSTIEKQNRNFLKFSSNGIFRTPLEKEAYIPMEIRVNQRKEILQIIISNNSFL